jgi:hypothetical protein
MDRISALKTREPKLAKYIGRTPWEAHLDEKHVLELALHRCHLEESYPERTHEFLVRHLDLRQYPEWRERLREASTPTERAHVEYELELEAYPFHLIVT